MLPAHAGMILLQKGGIKMARYVTRTRGDDPNTQ